MNVASSHVLFFGKFCNFVVFCEQCFSLGQRLSEQSLKQLLTWLRLYTKSKERSHLFFNAVTHFVGGKSQLKYCVLFNLQVFNAQSQKKNLAASRFALLRMK